MEMRLTAAGGVGGLRGAGIGAAFEVADGEGGVIGGLEVEG